MLVTTLLQLQLFVVRAPPNIRNPKSVMFDESGEECTLTPNAPKPNLMTNSSSFKNNKKSEYNEIQNNESLSTRF
jgi:hypothetical protein